MKNATAYARKLIAWLRKIRKLAASSVAPTPGDPLEKLIVAYLTWQCGRRQAEAGYQKLMRTMVDHNDLRVTDPRHVAAVLGDRHPRALERSQRLIRALHSIYHKEHQVSLDRLAAMPRRDARAYLDGLDGMMPFVSASVMLLGLGGHGVPVDEVLLGVLRQAGLVDPKATLSEVQAFLENQIKADDAPGVYEALRACVESLSAAEWKKATSLGTDVVEPPAVIMAAQISALSTAGKKGSTGSAAKAPGKSGSKAAAVPSGAVKARGGSKPGKTAPAASTAKTQTKGMPAGVKTKKAAPTRAAAAAHGKPSPKSSPARTSGKLAAGRIQSNAPAAKSSSSKADSGKTQPKSKPGNGAPAKAAHGKARGGTPGAGGKTAMKSGARKMAGQGAARSARR